MTSTTDPAPASGVTGQPQSPPSDNDSGERPVRKQLKETSIKSAPTTTEEHGNGRKRSFEDSRDEPDSRDDNGDNGESRRKRSRDCTPLDDTEITTSLNASASAKSENVSALNPMDSPLADPLDTAEKNTSPGPKTGLLEHELSENRPVPKSPTFQTDCTWKPTSWIPYDDPVISNAWLELLSKKADPILNGSSSESDETSECTELDPEILPDSEDEQSEWSNESDEINEPIDSPVYPHAHELYGSNVTESTARAQSPPLELSHISIESGSRAQSALPVKPNTLFGCSSHHEQLPHPDCFNLGYYDDCYPPSEPLHIHSPAQVGSSSAPYCPPEYFDLDDDNYHPRSDSDHSSVRVESHGAQCSESDDDDCVYLRTEPVKHPSKVRSNGVPWCPPPEWDSPRSPVRLDNVNLERLELAETNSGHQRYPSASCHPPEAVRNPQAAPALMPLFCFAGYAPQPIWTGPSKLQTQYPSYSDSQSDGLGIPYPPDLFDPLDAKYDPATLEADYGTPRICSGLAISNAGFGDSSNFLSQEPVQSSLDLLPEHLYDQASDYSELDIFPPGPSDHDDSIIFKVEYDEQPSTPSEEPSAHFSSEKELSSPHTPSMTDLEKKDNENNNTNAKLQDPKRSTTTDTPSSTIDDESFKALNKKRSLEQLEDSGTKNDTKNDPVQEPTSTSPANAKSTTDGEREKKRHRDNSQEREIKNENDTNNPISHQQAFAASAFGKAAAASPFASLGSTKDSADKPASASPFASSSMAGFAGSENSPFGTLGASTPSVFKPAATGTSSFAAPSTTSGFGALGSGFSGVGGGFAAAAKPGGLTSFASSNAPATLGTTKTKTFGAEDSEGDDSDNNDDEEETNTFEAAKTDERFYEQTIETGEEEEVTVFSCKAKLFSFVNKEWKERGIGTFKLNATQTDDGYANGRMIMRADGAMRVMLNSPIFSGMNYGDNDNNTPTTKQILLTGNEEGRRVPMLLRTGSEALAQELHEHIKGLLGKSD
ncbi:hypothetical protein N7478_008273 [Penicillium angulare]|uniref:uncharacterized protein n=1 Tax=Penicillium angulare TaxID=116970 RepID=UPI002541C496|nr:uncharacterized protein N7478_008273 [Penicillium angulare]KAJ5273148.1 hypothetical protein N7478_008273 [Penicillium angulare]